jgi:hypothetical protein
MRGKIVTVAVEGDHDAAVVRRILESLGLEVGTIYGGRGKGALDKALGGYNHAARHSPWLVLRDLDHDAPCAVELVRRLVPEPAPQLCLRVVVRSIEAWLMADREGVSRFLTVAAERVPDNPEVLVNPKQALIELAKHSRVRAIRQDMVPAPGTGAQVGRGYTGRIIEFASEFWQPSRAARRSESLRRCLKALRHWK